MKIKYRSNLLAGCLAIVAAAVLFLIIPSQVGLESSATYGITSRTLPYACLLYTSVSASLRVVSNRVSSPSNSRVVKRSSKPKPSFSGGALTSSVPTGKITLY